MKWNKFNATQHAYSFNFWIGCHKFTEGCKNCYMFIAQQRRTVDPTQIRRGTTTWGEPLKRQRKAEKAGEYKSVFACSYSDFFLPEADGWRDDAWALIRQTPNLIWQLASKLTHLIAFRFETLPGIVDSNCTSQGIFCERRQDPTLRNPENSGQLQGRL